MSKIKLDGYSLTAKLIKLRKNIRFTATEQALFYELINVCNEKKWEKYFSCSNGELCNSLSISENTLKVARQTLIDNDLITYRSGKSRRTVGLYSFSSTGTNKTTSNFAGETATVKKGKTVKENTTTAETVAETTSNFAGETADYIINSKVKGKLNNTNTICENSFSQPDENSFKIIEEDKPPLEKKENELPPPKSKPAPAKKEKPPVHPAYQPIVDHWLKVVHPGWTFGPMTGTKVKSIIRKLEVMIKQNNVDPTPETVASYFELICSNLPAWFKDKDLAVIDSKFNEIIEQIKNTLHGTGVNKPTDKYNKAASYFD